MKNASKKYRKDIKKFKKSAEKSVKKCRRDINKVQKSAESAGKKV